MHISYVSKKVSGKVNNFKHDQAYLKNELMKI